MPHSDAKAGLQNRGPPLSLNLAISVLRHPGEELLEGAAARMSSLTFRSNGGETQTNQSKVVCILKGIGYGESEIVGRHVDGFTGERSGCDTKKSNYEQIDESTVEVMRKHVVSTEHNEERRKDVKSVGVMMAVAVTTGGGSLVVVRDCEVLLCGVNVSCRVANTVLLGGQTSMNSRDSHTNFNPFINPIQTHAHCHLDFKAGAQPCASCQLLSGYNQVLIYFKTHTLAYNTNHYQAKDNNHTRTHNQVHKTHAQTHIQTNTFTHSRTNDNNHALTHIKGHHRSKTITCRITPYQPNIKVRGSVTLPGEVTPPPSCAMTTTQLHAGPWNVSATPTHMAEAISLGNASRNPSDMPATRELKSPSPTLPHQIPQSHQATLPSQDPLPHSLPSSEAGRRRPRKVEAALVLLMLLMTSPVNGYDHGGPQHTITWGRANSPGPAVFAIPPSNVTAVKGHHARLPCTVTNLGHKDLSWIRKRDLHILTVGIFTYTTDDRFKVFHPPETESWDLDVSSVTFRDSGVYECQVSTSPKVSLPILLTVLGQQTAVILGSEAVYVQRGSTISLECEVPAGPEVVGAVTWFHGHHALNYSSPRGGISMEVEKTPSKTTSKLHITRAVRQDSGNYTCRPKLARAASVTVHVVTAGEESAAAVQSGCGAARASMVAMWACLGAVWALHGALWVVLGMVWAAVHVFTHNISRATSRPPPP